VKVKLPQGVEQPLSAFWDGGDHTERLESAEGNGESHLYYNTLYIHYYILHNIHYILYITEHTVHYILYIT
jgi:hypothetical protein